MPRLPDGIAYQVLTKTEGQVKWQVEEQFIVDAANGYEEGFAVTDSWDLFNQLVADHVGGPREYRIMRCEERAHEVRPVE